MGTKQIQTPFYNEGVNKKIAFLFEVPGEIEEIENKPVVEVIGDHLDILLKMLNDGIIFDSENRYDYRISNAYYVNQETNKKAIRVELKAEIEKFDYCIAFGKEAQEAFEELFGKESKEPVEIKSCCIGNKGLGRTYPKCENNQERLEKVADSIKAQIKSNGGQ